MAQSTWPGANNWPLSSNWPTTGSLPGPQFPRTVTPAVWFDGNQQAFSDSAGTLPVSSGLIRRINEPASTGGNWTTPTDAERPFRDSNGVRFECIGSAGGYQMTRASAGGINASNCSLCFSWVARDSSFAGPLMGAFRSDDLNVGIRISSNNIWVYYNAGTNWFTTLTVAPGLRNTILVNYTPTGITVTLNAGGVITTQSLVVAVTSTVLGAALRIGLDGVGYMYGSVVQAFLAPAAMSAGETLGAMTWTHAQLGSTPYPDDRALIAFVGDSITRMTACPYGFGYPFLALASVRTSGKPSEACDVAVGGTGVTGLLQPISDNQSLVLRANAFYSSTRVKNVMVFLLGTNDLANGNSVAYLLNGTGAAAGSGLYPACDYVRARGWKVVIATIGPRSDAMGVSQVTYNTNRAAANTDIAANWPSHADAFWDTRGITNFGADGDSDNPTFYSADKIHPTQAGHALLGPTAASTILALL